MTYNLSWARVKDYKSVMWREVPDDYQGGMMEFIQRFDDGKLYAMRPVSNSICLVMMNVGIREITAKTIEEFWIRSQMFYDVHGDPLTRWVPDDDGNDHPTPYRWTLDDLYRHIGLGSNASSLTRTQFEKLLTSAMREKHRNAFRRHAQEAGERVTV